MASDSQWLEALRVDLAALRRRGIDVHDVRTSLPASWLAHALRDTDAEVEDEASLALQLLLQPEGVVVARGTLGLHFSVPCGRCLSPAAVDGSTEIFATYMPSAAAAEAGASWSEEDEDDEPVDDQPDVFGYDGPVLHLDAMIGEQVALAYPMRALCDRGDDCRGLCSNCGYELNTVPRDVRRCPQCHSEVPLTPVADPPAQREERDSDSPLAAALKALDLE